jgi:hypothetical protein
MLSASGPLLERHHIFHSRDPEETRARPDRAIRSAARRPGTQLIRRLGGRGPLQVLMHDCMNHLMHDHALFSIVLIATISAQQRTSSSTNARS